MTHIAQPFRLKPAPSHGQLGHPCFQHLADDWNQSRHDPKLSEVDLGDGRILIEANKWSWWARRRLRIDRVGFQRVGIDEAGVSAVDTGCPCSGAGNQT